LSQWGVDFPVQGMNEKGLTGFALNQQPIVPSTMAPTTSLSELEWLQFQLDHYENVVAILRDGRGSEVTQLSGQLQYFFCDRSGQCLELHHTPSGLDGTIIPPHQTIATLTNAPFAATLDQYIKSRSTWNSQDQLPQGYNADLRFFRLAWWLDPTANHSQSSTQQILSQAQSSTLTAWQVFFSPDQLLAKIQHKSGYLGTITANDLLKFAVCDQKSEALGVMKLMSNDTDRWQPIDGKLIRKTLNSAAFGVSGYNQKVMDRIVNLASQVTCQK
jgi:hypothetical protein